MSSMLRGSARATGETFCNGIVRRMVSLPRSILGGFSRAMGQGIDLMGIGGGRRNQNPPSNFPLQHPIFPHQQQQPQEIIEEEWAFLASFEQQYGTIHPFFYACLFTEALKMAKEEQKFVFMYLHSPEHPFTPPFCRETLSSELVCCNRLKGQFPQLNWWRSSRGQWKEQGLAFGSTTRAKEEEKRRADRRLREDQDAAYLAALQIDKEKEKLKTLPSEERVQKQVEASNKVNYEKLKQNPTTKQSSKVKEATTTNDSSSKDISSRGKDAQVSQILIRFPNGERKEQSFSSTDKIQSIYRYIDSLGLPGVGNYRLISNFPRKVYGVDQMGMTLKDAGLHPKASLFLELL
ncbi:hypothetical protein F0562_024287 [Nyssa sinensis]|uniref:UBX domain-containing protein n=1 Tax=Nyssa sinensis TaxID=561372 RepID=A0A5J5BDQ6_9ASTE|nr:hypothetical protein F0562_024287 [Nyssa sinensis]